MKNLKQNSLFIIFFLTFLFITNPIRGGEVDKKLHEKCINPTIYISLANHKNYGSGVIVRSEKVKPHKYKNVFITCGHIVEDSMLDYEVRQFIYEDYLEIKEIKTYPAVFSAVNHEQDLAIGVFYSETKQAVAELDFNPKLHIGNDVYRVGCGITKEPRLDYGKLTSYNNNIIKPYLRTSVFTVPGDSGSPLFHEYKVVGIIVSIISKKNMLFFKISCALPLKNFKAWNILSNNAISYIWDEDEELPELPFYYLNFSEYNIK